MNGTTARVSAAALARYVGSVDAAEHPVYRWLAARIRAGVLDGRLALDATLPSERDLATGMDLSRTTVGAAYTLLREQGWISSRRGSGSRLRLPDTPHRLAAAPRAPFGPAGIHGWDTPLGSDPIDLTTACLPAPAEALGVALAAATTRLPRYLAADGYQPFGLRELREATAERYTRAGAPTTAEQILVTNGAQHALSLAFGTLSVVGDRVLVECPTYPVALDALLAGGRVPTTVGLQMPTATLGGGWDVELFAATLRHSTPRLAYLIPDFHNPTGALMDTRTREQIVAAARSAGTLVLADESNRELSFAVDGPMPESMATLDDGSRVLSLGSMSKAFWGGLRVGWIRSSPALIRRLARARALTDMAGPILDQLIAVELLHDPEPGLAVQRARLAAGSAAVLGTLADELPDWRPTRPGGGMCVWVQLPGPFAAELTRQAAGAGVQLAPGSRFGPDGTLESFVRLPITADPDRLREAVRRLAGVTAAAARTPAAQFPAGWLT